MDQALKDVFAEYDARIAREAEVFRAGGPVNIDDMLLAVGPVVGRFMHTLIVGHGAKRIVELGTSYGYSVHWLADAARETGGRVITMDVAADKQAYARKRIERAGLSAFVEFRTGNAVDLLAAIDEPIDFVLLDIWKDLYVACLETFFPKLSPGAVVVADNMLRPVDARPHAEAYQAAIRGKPGVQSMLLAMGSGIELSRKAA
jgi:predicted O-methyltransferase YrrM